MKHSIFISHQLFLTTFLPFNHPSTLGQIIHIKPTLCITNFLFDPITLFPHPWLIHSILPLISTLNREFRPHFFIYNMLWAILRRQRKFNILILDIFSRRFERFGLLWQLSVVVCNFSFHSDNRCENSLIDILLIPSIDLPQFLHRQLGDNLTVIISNDTLNLGLRLFPRLHHLIHPTLFSLPSSLHQALPPTPSNLIKTTKRCLQLNLPGP